MLSGGMPVRGYRSGSGMSRTNYNCLSFMAIKCLHKFTLLLFQTAAKWNLLLAIAVAAGNRYRPQLSTAIDRRFFREAYNQEGILTALADSIKQLDSVEEIAALLSVEIS